MSYVDEGRFHTEFEMQRQHVHLAMAKFAGLIARWNARREQKRRDKYANFGLSDDVLRDIGVNRFQIMAAELATDR